MKTKNPVLIDHQQSIPHRSMILYDSIVIVATFLLAYFLRYSSNLDSFIFVLALKQAFFAWIVYLVFELLFKPFGGHTIRSTFQTILWVLVSTTCSVVILMLITFLSSHLAWQIEILNMPRSILLIHYLLVFIMCSILRIGFRLLIKV